MNIWWFFRFTMPRNKVLQKGLSSRVFVIVRYRGAVSRGPVPLALAGGVRLPPMWRHAPLRDRRGCAACHQVSLTAGTLFHATKLADPVVLGDLSHDPIEERDLLPRTRPAARRHPDHGLEDFERDAIAAHRAMDDYLGGRRSGAKRGRGAPGTDAVRSRPRRRASPCASSCAASMRQDGQARPEPSCAYPISTGSDPGPSPARLQMGQHHSKTPALPTMRSDPSMSLPRYRYNRRLIERFNHGV